jgi:CBS domain-containing protein
MAVSQILNQKGRSVISAPPEETLHAIAKILEKHRIGAVVIIGTDGAISGIVSERDVVRALAEFGAAALSKTAAEVMTRTVRTCGPGDTEAELMALMTEHRIRHLPVMDRNRLAGMISIGDVVKLRIATIEREAEEMKSYIASAG